MNISNNKILVKARETKSEHVTCNFIYCEYASSKFKLRLSNGSSIDFKTGNKIKLPENISMFYVENTTDDDLIFHYIAGFGDFSDDSVKLSGSISVFSGNIMQCNFVNCAGNAICVRPYNNKRNCIMLQNNSGEDVIVGGDDVSLENKNGYIIKDDGMLSLSIKSAIYASSVSGSLSVVEILED